MAQEQRQQQVAVKSAAEKAESDRKSAANELARIFAKKHNLADKLPKGIGANPFSFEGENVWLFVEFQQMQSATTGIFFMRDEGVLVVNDIPC